MKIRIVPNNEQLKILDEWFNTSNYVYNKAIEEVKKDLKVSFINLRDKLVTNETKKTQLEYIKIDEEIREIRKELNIFRKEKNKEKEEEFLKIISNKNIEKRAIAKTLNYSKNEGIREWELKTPKEIRANSVKSVIDARTSAISNLIAGNIKKFEFSYRKRVDNDCISLQKNLLKIIDSRQIFGIQIAPNLLKENKIFKVGKGIEKTIRKYNIKINNDCKLIRNNGYYYVIVPIETEFEEHFDINSNLKYCGVDPGIRTFMTTFGPDKLTEYNFRMSLVEKLDLKIKKLKDSRSGRSSRSRLRKKSIYKLEKNKQNYIEELHWKTIKHLLDNNDVVFYGDIKSHGIVKNKENQEYINKATNNLKFYQFKQKLLYKAKLRNKYVYVVNEAFTTKTCTNCGHINDPGASKIYSCDRCKIVIPRDGNGARNILMKGLEERIMIN